MKAAPGVVAYKKELFPEIGSSTMVRFIGTKSPLRQI